MSDPRLALITGGGRGLGRAAALHLAEGGADVILTYHASPEAAAAVVAEVRAAGRRAAALPLDTADTAGFAGFRDRLAALLAADFGRADLDLLLNNAGTGHHAAFAATTEADFDALMKVHLKGPFFLTQTLLPLIRDGGRILNVSSGLARFALPGYAAYAAMKGGVEVLTRYLARELGPRGIAVNCIAPGAIATDFGGGAVRDNPELNRMIAGATAMGRVGLPDDIGGAVAALLLGELGWMTGQRIEVSGGQNL